MKNPILRTAVLAASVLIAFTGCDWESGGDSNSFNGRYNWVNFSGVYRPTSGLYVVTNFSDGVGAGGGDEDATDTASETIAMGDGTTTTFNGTLTNNSVVPDSVVISTSGFTLSDDGNGNLVGAGATGAIEYATGSWSVDFGGSAPDDGSPLIASYSFAIGAGSGGGTTLGSSGFELFSFVVEQGGERIVLTDNTGRSYTGNMGTIRSTRGDSQDTLSDTAAPVAGDQIIGLFNAEGITPAGFPVTITGTLQAVVGAASQLTNRTMQGTWIEQGGVAGDINAQTVLL